MEREKTNFIINAIDEDNRNHVYAGDRVHTRFPPEPNGYLHIGHAKASLLNYRIAKRYDGTFNLRFDDTNPEKEDVEYVDSIKEDLAWLGVDWQDNLFFASSYFPRMIGYAKELIRKGLAYVDDQDADTIRENRGTLTEPGTESPCRSRGVEENEQLFQDMIDGKVPEGQKVLRAKIDMASSNMNYAGPRHLSGAPHRPPQFRRGMVRLSHVRLSPTRWKTPSKASPTPCAPWNLRITAPFTTGTWNTWTNSRRSPPARSSLPSST